MSHLQAELSLNNANEAVQIGLTAIAAGETDFDLSSLKTADSAAVAVLLQWQRAAGERRQVLTLHAVPPNLLSLMHLYGVEELFTIIAPE